MSGRPPPPPPGLGDLPPPPPGGGAGHDLDLSVDLVDEIEDLDEPETSQTLAQAGVVYLRMGDGRVVGPYETAAVAQMVRNGQLTGHEAASLDQSNWASLSSFPGLADLGPPAPMAPPPPPAGMPPASAPVTASQPAGDFDFSFGAPAPRQAAQADDFDFSFGDGPAPPTQPLVAAPAAAPSGGDGLNDLFDDLPDDLPAPKAPSPFADLGDLPAPKPRGITDLPAPKHRGIVDLPAPKEGVTDLPGPSYRDLPGPAHSNLPTPAHTNLPGLTEGNLPMPKIGVTDLPGIGGLPGVGGVPGVGGTPGEIPLPDFDPSMDGIPAPSEGLIAPEDAEGLPDLPMGDAAALFEEATAELEAAGDVADKPRKGGARKAVLALVGLLVVGGGAAGALFALEVGPFAPPPPPPRKPKPKPKVDKPIVLVDAGVTVAVPDQFGIVETKGATLAEVAGYRNVIAKLESEKPEHEKLGTLVEFYAFGSLEFQGNDAWTKKAGEMSGKLDIYAETVPGQRAVLAAALAGGDPEAITKVDAFAKANTADARAQYLLGHARRAAGDVKGALTAFRAAVEADATFVPAQRLAGELALKAGELDDAKKTLEALYKLAPGAPVVANALARIEIRQGKPERAAKLLDQVLLLDAERLSGRDKSAALLTRARLELDRKQEDGAMASLEEAIRAFPSNLEAVDLLSDRHFASKQFDRALEQFENLESAGVSSPQISIKIAQCHQALGSRPRALKVLEKAQEKFATDPTVPTALGDLQITARKNEEARASYQRALEIDPKYTPARLSIANLLVKEAKVQEAIAYLDEALKASPDSALLHVGVADLRRELYESSGDAQSLAAAEKGYLEALAIDASQLEARRHLAIVLLEKGDAKAALAQLQTLEARPDFHGDLDFEFGQVQQVLGKLTEAVARYEKAVARYEAPRYLTAAGSAQFELNVHDKARDMLAKAVTLDRKNEKGFYYLGRVDMAQEKCDDAQVRFERALELDKGNQAYHYWLGRALQCRGKDEPAAQEYDGVLKNTRKSKALSIKLCDVYFRRAQMWLRKGLPGWQSARGLLEEAQVCNPEHAEVWLLHGQLVADMQDKKASMASLNRALKVKKCYGEAHLAIFEKHLKFEPVPSTKKMQQRLREAVRCNPELCEAHFALANILKDKSQAAARKHLKLYVKHCPEGRNIKGIREMQRLLGQ